MALLEVKNLTKAFGGLKAVSDVTFHVKEGEIMGLIGPNGSGKQPFSTVSTITSPLRPATSCSREKASRD